jgi:hypothetical protein
VTGYRAEVADALRALDVIPPASYAWFGRRTRSLPPDVLVAATPAEVRASLVAALERELYRSFFTQGRPLPASPERPVSVRRDTAFARALSAANTGVGGWQAGWRVAALEAGDVLVARDGIAVRASAADCRPLDGVIVPGATVDIRRPKELGALSPGFYTALGDRPPGTGAELRVYFHVTAAGAAPLVGACTSALNAAAVPFVLKVVDRPGGFTRCDAAVLYLEPGGLERARVALAEIVDVCAPHLRDETPAFTKRLGAGVAAGEHHTELGASFGGLRCRAVAEGAVTAREAGAASLEDRLVVVARRFAALGLDLDRPYLAPAPSHAL